MKKLLLFGGTSEERGLIEALALYPRSDYSMRGQRLRKGAFGPKKMRGCQFMLGA